MAIRVQLAAMPANDPQPERLVHYLRTASHTIDVCGRGRGAEHGFDTRGAVGKVLYLVAFA